MPCVPTCGVDSPVNEIGAVSVWSGMVRLPRTPTAAFRSFLKPKPIPRWDVHFWDLEDDRKDSTASHITFELQLGSHRDSVV